MVQKSDSEAALIAYCGIRLSPWVKLQGVRPELMLVLIVISSMCNFYQRVALITSILNGEHMRNSLHYTGAAVDFVPEPKVDQTAWAVELRSYLGPEYDVINEGTHIHVEYQPHVGAAY